MTLSGTYIEGFSNNGAFQLRVVWSATQNINENYSVVTANLYIDSLQSWATVYDATTSSTSLSINGNVKYFSNNSTIGAWESKWLGKHAVTVYHTNDGSKWFDIYATHNFDITWNGSYIGTVDVYDSDWLNTIPRASVPTVTTSGILYGGNVHVNLNRASEDFTHYVFIDIGNVQTAVGNMDQYTNAFDFALPLDWCARIPNLSSNAGKFTVHTYNGNGDYIGTNEVWFTATVPTSVVPTISAGQVTNVEAVAGLASKFGTYVQTKSKIRATVAGTGAFVGAVQCSNIVGYRIQMNGQTFNTADATSEILNNSGSQNIIFSVTDSRGRTASRTVTVSALAYSPPVLSILKASRCEADGTLNDEGEYAKVTIGATISAVSYLNDKTFTISKKTVTTEIWTDEDVPSVPYEIETDVIISGISGNNAWDIKFTVADYFSSASKTMQLSTAFSLIDYFNGGKGLAFGKVAEKEGFENDLQTWFTGGIEAIALPTGDGTILYWQDVPGGYYHAVLGSVAGQPSPSGLVQVIRHETDFSAIWYDLTSRNIYWLYGSSAALNGWTLISGIPVTYEPTLLNSWVNYGDGFAAAEYWKDSDNVVHITGLIKDGGVADGTVIFTLPVGFRPGLKELFPSTLSSGTGRIDVNDNGNVVVKIASATYTSLAGISFLAKN